MPILTVPIPFVLWFYLRFALWVSLSLDGSGVLVSCTPF